MTQEHLQDALGMIDDDMIAAVDQKRLQRDLTSDSLNNNVVFSSFRKKVMRREILKWGSLAASLFLFIGVGFLWRSGGHPAADSQDPGENQYSHQENAVQDSIFEEILDLIPEQKNECDVEQEMIIQNNSGTEQPETTPGASPETDPETAPTAFPLPTLLLVNETDFLQAFSGTCYWSQTNSDGTTYHIESKALHPLDPKAQIPQLTTSEPSLQLQFISAPDHSPTIEIRYWDESCLGDTSAKGQTLFLVDGQLPLQTGGHIYEITVKWNQGTISYSCYVCFSPNTP